MFGDKYKKDMENIKPSAENLERTLEMMKRAAPKKIHRRRQIITAAACMAAVIGTAALFPVISSKLTNFSAGEVPPGGIYGSSLNGSNAAGDVPTEDCWVPDCSESDGNSAAGYKQLCALIANEIKKYGDNSETDIAEPDTEETQNEDEDGIDEGKDSPAEDPDFSLESFWSDTTINSKEWFVNHAGDLFAGANITGKDENFIYCLKGSYLSVLSAKDSNTELLRVIKMERPSAFVDLVPCNGKLALIRNESGATVAEIYSVSENGETEKLTEFRQSGVYVSGVFDSGRLYIVSSDKSMLELAGAEEYIEDEIIDKLPVSGTDAAKTVAAENIYIYGEGLTFTVASCFDTENCGYVSVAVMGNTDSACVKDGALYVCKNGYDTRSYTIPGFDSADKAE